MDYLSLFIIWIIICLSLWFFNAKYRNYHHAKMILFTILDSVLVFFLLYLTTLNGYITGILPFVVCLLGSMGLIYFRIRNDDDYDVELTLEMVKNAFIIFNRTVLPFMISLTIFRFMPFYFQILLSLLVVVVIQFLSFFMQKITVRFVASMRSDFIRYRPYIAIVLIFFGILVFIVMFDFPTYKVEKTVNLQHHTPIYGFYDGYDTELDSSYDLQLVDEYEETHYNYPDPPVVEDLPNKFYLGFPISQLYYDIENDTTYETYYDDLNKTYFIKIDSNNNEEVYEFRGIRSLMVVDDIFYILNKDSNVIEMADENLNITSILRIPRYYAFYNNPTRSAEFFYSIENGELLLTSVEISNEELYYHKQYIIIQNDIDITLPFYSHFGLFHIVIVFIIMFIPITNYKSYVTVIDFESQVKKSTPNKESDM